jgi:hypothetical protein
MADGEVKTSRGCDLIARKSSWWSVHGVPTVALGYSTFAAIAELLSFLTLYYLPPGTGIRPMGWPVEFLFFGLLPLVFSFATSFVTFKVHQSRQGSDCIVPRIVMTIACLISIVPFLLTTVGMYWVIHEHKLWIKP